MAWDKTYCHLLCVCRQAVKSIYARLSIFGNKSIITCHSEAWAHISAPHKTNSSSQALMCQNITSEAFTELRLSNSRRQTQGRHPPQGTHAPLRTLRAWETWAQTEDCMVLLTTPLPWATRQVGFEGKTNAATGLLSTLPKGNCLLSSLMSLPSPCRAANTYDGQLKIQTGKAAGLLSPQGETESSDPLSSHSESPGDDCSAILPLA